PMASVSLRFVLFAFSFGPAATPTPYALSLHDALPIYFSLEGGLQGLVRVARAEEVGVADEEGFLVVVSVQEPAGDAVGAVAAHLDRKSTRLNSSHVKISYAVFCLKKKSGPYRPEIQGA